MDMNSNEIALPYNPRTKTPATVTEVGDLLLVISQDEEGNFVVGLYRELTEAPLAHEVVLEDTATTVVAANVRVAVWATTEPDFPFVRAMVGADEHGAVSWDGGQTWEALR